MGTSFLPETDNGAVQIEVTAPSGSSLEYTRIKAEQAAALARALPEVEYTQTTVGTSGNVSRAQVYVDFIPEADRERTARQIAQALRGDIARLVGAEFTQLWAELRGHRIRPAAGAVRVELTKKIVERGDENPL